MSDLKATTPEAGEGEASARRIGIRGCELHFQLVASDLEPVGAARSKTSDPFPRPARLVREYGARRAVTVALAGKKW